MESACAEEIADEFDITWTTLRRVLEGARTARRLERRPRLFVGTTAVRD